MELGEKLRQARLKARLSQRQLCADVITRNMLSQIESGKARPSMKTLQYLAGRLGKPVSYFLEETAVVSPNQEVMASARRLYDAGDCAGAVLALADYQAPDEVYDREARLLRNLANLTLAGQALAEGRGPYASALLEKVDCQTAYCAEALRRQKLLLLGKLPGHSVCSQLPSLDEELLLRAREALNDADARRAEALLEAAEDHTGAQWNLLRGAVSMSLKDYASAAGYLHRAEAVHPAETARLLELCYRELGDYKQAYEYACKQR